MLSGCHLLHGKHNSHRVPSADGELTYLTVYAELQLCSTQEGPLRTMA
jgi:hypothetical protein